MVTVNIVNRNIHLSQLLICPFHLTVFTLFIADIPAKHNEIRMKLPDLTEGVLNDCCTL